MSKTTSIFGQRITLAMSALLFCMWLIWLAQFSNFAELFSQYLQFGLLGISGAIFANATGAGGGVIFIPVFDSLSFTPSQSISTSFAIQCFGMTAGAITWWRYYQSQNQQKQWQELPRILYWTVPFSILGIWTAYLIPLQAPAELSINFGYFSIVLGVAIAISVLKKIANNKDKLLTLDVMVLSFLSYIGGIITAWLSVGVGEILVIYLMLRGYSATLAVAAGVIVTALTVWSVALIHLNPDGDAYFDIVLFAGPGAIIGGILAKRLVLWMPIRLLKLFFAAWIIISGLHIFH